MTSDLARAATTANTNITDQAFEVHPLGSALGGELTGIDLARPLSERDLRRVQQASFDHGVIVFRQQRLTPAQHIAFSRRFGPLQIHVLAQFLLPGHPEILIVSNERRDGRPIGLGDAGHYWHSDLSYKETPSLGSQLHAQTLPAEGGDTLFANMYMAYESLPAEIRQLIHGRKAAHAYTKTYGELQKKADWRPNLSADQISAVPQVWHPMVRIHPGTGRAALFVNEGFTTQVEGLPDDAGRALLKLLFEHSTRPAHVYRHRWQEGDLVFWDNRATIHLAAGCPPHLARTLYRTTIEGEAPIPATRRD